MPGTDVISWENPSVRRCITLLILLTCQHVGAQEPAAAPPILVLDSGGHTARVTNVIFSPDGNKLITVSWDKTIRTWDVETGEAIKVLRPPIGRGPEGRLYAAALSPDGETLAVGGWGPPNALGRIYLISMTSGRIERVLDGHKGPLRSLAFAPGKDGGRRLASGSDDTTARLWNVGTGQCEQELKEHTARVTGVSFAPDGHRLVTASSDKTARIWSVTDGRREHVLTGHSREVSCVAWSPDGKFLATGGQDRSIRFYGSDGTFSRSFEGRENGVTSVVFTSDSKELLYTWGGGDAPDAGAALLAISSDRERVRFASHDGAVLAGALSPDGLLGASAGGRSHEVRLWKTTDGTTLRRLVGKGKPVNSIGWSPDDRTIAWGDTPAGAIRPLERAFHLASLEPAKVSDTGYTMASRSLGSMRLVYSGPTTVDVKRGKDSVKFQLKDPLDRVRCFSLLKGGSNRAIVGTDQGSLFLIDTHSGQELPRSFESHGDAILAVAAIELGMFLTASSDQSIRIWDPDRDQPLLSLFFTGDEWIAWTPEGYYAASAGGENLMGWQVDDNDEQVGKFLRGTDRHTKLHRPDVIKLLLPTGSLARALERTGPPANSQAEDPLVNRYEVRGAIVMPNLNKKLFVLTIGVSNYAVESIRLKCADKDALELERILNGKAGKEAFSEVQVKHLVNEQATPENIFACLKWLKQEMTKDDVGIIFYSGHGDRDSDDIFYMLPVGVDPEHLDVTAVAGEVFKKKLAGIKGSLVVMLDACHAGQFAKGIGENKQLRPRAEEFAKGTSQEQPGVVIMCSSTGDEVSIEDRALGHGYFTQALIEGLYSRAADSNGDGFVNLKELDTYLFDRVNKLSHNTQNPITFNPGAIPVVLSRTAQ